MHIKIYIVGDQFFLSGKQIRLCNYKLLPPLLSDDVNLVEDAKKDHRCLATPLVAGEFGLQFYAAAPLKSSDGYNIGTFCMLDKKKRFFNTEQRVMLKQMSRIVMREIELRLQMRFLVQNYANTPLEGN